MADENPYQFGAAVDRGEKHDEHKVLVPEFTQDMRRDIGFTSTVITVGAVVCVLGAVAALLQIWATFWFLGVPRDATTILIVGTRALYAPTFGFIAWTMWKYAGCLKRLGENGVVGIHAAVDRQNKMWRAIGCLFIVLLLAAGLIFGMSVPR